MPLIIYAIDYFHDIADYFADYAIDYAADADAITPLPITLIRHYITPLRHYADAIIDILPLLIISMILILAIDIAIIIIIFIIDYLIY
jgi:hypothetical protein